MSKNTHIKKIKAKNEEQQFLIDSLKDDTIKYIAATGRAGTGKTYVCTNWALTALASGHYEKLYIARSVTPVKNESLGYDPGPLVEKLAEWLRPITDNFGKFMEDNEDIQGKVEFVSLAKIRGRSIENSILYIEEAQNLSLDLMLAILTRIDKDSKAVFCGDFKQSDLTHHMTDFERVCIALDGMAPFDHIELYESVRSPYIQEIEKRIEAIQDDKDAERYDRHQRTSRDFS